MKTRFDHSKTRFAPKTRSPPSKRRRLVGRSKIIWADSDSEDVRDENTEEQLISADENFVVKDPFAVEGEFRWGEEDFNIEDTSRPMEKRNSESDDHVIEKEAEEEGELDLVVEMERWSPVGYIHP